MAIVGVASWRQVSTGHIYREAKVGKKVRSTSGVVAFAVALAVMLAVIPAAGDHLPSGDDPGGAGFLRLHLGSDAQQFVYEPLQGGATTQAIGSNRCEVTLASNPPLATLSGNNRGPGINGTSLGVKSGGSQGVPCGRIDATEHLTIGLGNVPLAAEADLDLELKGDSKVTIEVYLDGVKRESFEVRSGASVVAGQGVDGTSGEPFSAEVETDDPQTGVNESIANCKNQSDSGPDAGSRDNCRVTVHPALPFDAVKLIPRVGEISLEGSGDFGNDRAFDTIFYLTTFEGVLDCGDEVSDEAEGVSGTIIRHSNADGSVCIVKPYRMFVDTADESVVFEIGDPASQEAFYEATIVLQQPLTTPLSAALEYDPEPPYDAFKQAPACTAYPFQLDANGDRVIDSETGLPIPVEEAIPDGHEACVISVTQEWDGNTTWHAVFMGDWKFR